MSATLTAPAGGAVTRRPRIGFLGTGWIGRHRMQAMLATGAIEPAAVADPAPEAAAAASALAPGAEVVGGLSELLARDLDGLVIATPSGLHAEQSIAALEQGVAVFCQKPLGRRATEAAAVVEAARAADRLLAVDLSYRFTAGMQQIREQVRGGALGRVFAADLVFHNAYGPDKAWFYEPALAGGGCVMDLGVHLVDLALWVLDFPAVERVESTLLAAGAALAAGQVEDYAVATLHLATGQVVRLACSWRLQAGCDADISAAFWGDAGGAALRNIGGSFYDFEADAFAGVQRRPLSRPPDDWGGRAAARWAKDLASGRRFDPRCAELIQVSEVLDRIYGR
ncbi:Gfo/Idh/MocA family oxidoreductase [Phenylobacterium sp. LjRoot219]|uniref:Gfo/Idh/MocA family protein n=1 Tax=Phenylobacterium sp. LjRoot219 TaxID=3342283 RepID=UPI003ECC7F8D